LADHLLGRVAGRKLVITAPLDMFVEAIFVASGKVIEGQPLLKLDSRKLERELAHQMAVIDLLKIKSERLSESYLDEFVFGPLNEDLNYKIANCNILTETKKQMQHRFNVGEILRLDIDLAVSALVKSHAEVTAAHDEIYAHKVSVKKQLAMQQAAETTAREQVDLLKTQVDRTKVVSPWNATVRALTADGLFVEKGDSLIELTQL
jgi:multidrug resistance efflux pump